MIGSHNDFNVIQRSAVFSRLPDVHYEINDHQYIKEYYLANGIYSQWSTIVKTISNPQVEKRSRFAKERD